MALEQINSPADLRSLGPAELSAVADEIREFLVDKVARTGGHLGPNLGAVELTLALHRVYDSPNDVIVWDTGHQAYVHKIVTGRRAGFAELREYGGLSGYPSREESRHDVIENSHASTSLSYAAGFAEAFARHRLKRKVVAVIGDGAFTGGMAYEALNQIAHHKWPIVIVLNDNGRSYSPTVGGLAEHLAQLRIDPLYQRAKKDVADVLHRFARPGDLIASGMHRIKTGLRDLVTESTVFDALGLAYSGPIDGHDIEAVERALAHASELDGPVVVHLITKKGAGYAPAEEDERDHFHGVGKFDPETGTVKSGGGVSWTAVFGDAIVQEADANPDVVAITAAMQDSVGLTPFGERFPERCYDVGIAEQHGVTFAAGLAMGGMRPVVAVYATFMNRAVDQVMMDVALHRLPVVFVLDRAGITGHDGPSHHGIYDLALFRQVPGLVIAAPSDPAELRDLLHTALRHDGPFMIRFPKGSAPGMPEGAASPIPVGEWAVEEAPGGIAILAIGNMVDVARKAALILDEAGIPAAVTNARYVKPLDDRLPELARRHVLVATIEDHELQGGFGTGVVECLADAGVSVPVRRFGVPEQFLPAGSVSLLQEQCGLTPEQIAADLRARWEARIPAEA